jgi:hypothetical protein
MLLGTVARGEQAARPVIDHRVFTHPQARGYALVIEATITAAAGVRKAEVFCRPDGGGDFIPVSMVQHGGEHVYQAIVPDWMTAGSGLSYYITVTDQEGQSTSQGFVGFPLYVEFASAQPPSQEERLKALQGVIDTLRQQRETPPPTDYRNPRDYNPPRNR